MIRAHSPSYFADALTVLVGRELRIRYKGSVLGILWAIVSPLALVAILHILFTHIVPLGIPRYAIFIYSALLPWQWFQGSLQTAAGTLNDNRDLVRTPFFPRPLLPAVVTGTNFILYLLALPVLLALLLIEGILPSPLLLLLPLVWLVQALFTLALSLLVAALGVIVRDVQHLLGVALLLWFYLTPVFYDVGHIDPSKSRWFLLNPMAVVVQAHRRIILDGAVPDPLPLVAWTVVAGLLLGASLALFRWLEDLVSEEV